MPTYQYACTDCGEQLEVVQKFTDDALTLCPSCDGRLRKVFSAVGVVFKGSGFYRNDSRAASNGSGSTKAPSSSDASGSDSSSSDSSSSGSSDSGKSASGKSASGKSASSTNSVSSSSESSSAKKERTAAA